VKEQDPLLDAVVEAARAADPLADPRWTRLAEGTLPQEEAEALRAQGEAGGVPAQAFEALAPMDAARRARVANRAAAALHGAEPAAELLEAATGSSKAMSALTSKSAAQKKRKVLVQLLLVGAIGVVVVGYVMFGKVAPKPPEPDLVATVAPAPPKNKFTLELESSPAGATVKEGDVVLGSTPIAITLDSAGKDTRVFTLSKDGFAKYTFRQGPASEDVRFIAALTKVDAVPLVSASANASSAPAPTVGKHTFRAPAATATATAPVQQPPPSSTLDVKLGR
jgi:hypothetical protein